jgi:hypothetical protein
MSGSRDLTYAIIRSPLPPCLAFVGTPAVLVGSLQRQVACNPVAPTSTRCKRTLRPPTASSIYAEIVHVGIWVHDSWFNAVVGKSILSKQSEQRTRLLCYTELILALRRRFGLRQSLPPFNPYYGDGEAIGPSPRLP